MAEFKILFSPPPWFPCTNGRQSSQLTPHCNSFLYSHPVRQLDHSTHGITIAGTHIEETESMVEWHWRSGIPQPTLLSTDLRPLMALSKIQLSQQWSIPYLTCMKEGQSRPRWAEYKTMASGGIWDDEEGTDIDDKTQHPRLFGRVIWNRP